jgi:hypothetical protein
MVFCFWLTDNCLERVGKAQAKPRNQQDIEENVGKGEVFGIVVHCVCMLAESKDSPIPGPLATGERGTLRQGPTPIPEGLAFLRIRHG